MERASTPGGGVYAARSGEPIKSPHFRVMTRASLVGDHHPGHRGQSTAGGLERKSDLSVGRPKTRLRGR